MLHVTSCCRSMTHPGISGGALQTTTASKSRLQGAASLNCVSHAVASRSPAYARGSLKVEKAIKEISHPTFNCIVYLTPALLLPISLQLLCIRPDLIFFDKKPWACSLSIHFIHILFPCKNFASSRSRTPPFCSLFPPTKIKNQKKKNSCSSFVLIILETRTEQTM